MFIGLTGGTLLAGVHTVLHGCPGFLKYIPLHCGQLLLKDRLSRGA